jgi:hypothetical protein
MYRKMCLALVLLLVTYPCMALGSIVIDGGQPAPSVSVPSVMLLGRVPVLIPGSVRDMAQAFLGGVAGQAQVSGQLPDLRGLR